MTDTTEKKPYSEAVLAVVRRIAEETDMFPNAKTSAAVASKAAKIAPMTDDELRKHAATDLGLQEIRSVISSALTQAD